MMAVALVFCDGKVKEKALTVSDMIYWDKLMQLEKEKRGEDYNISDIEKHGIVQRSDPGLNELIKLIFEFVIINLRFMRNKLKMKGAVYVCELYESKKFMKAMRLSENSEPNLKGFM